MPAENRDIFMHGTIAADAFGIARRVEIVLRLSATADLLFHDYSVSIQTPFEIRKMTGLRDFESKMCSLQSMMRIKTFRGALAK